ncbi:MAG: hypothetical protein V3573_00080 [Desulfovibrionaceae bacterium]
MRARTVCWLLSALLHLVVLGAILVWTMPDARVFFVEPGMELTDEELDRLMPEEYDAPPEVVDISPHKVLVTYGGRNATEEEIFREFAEGGGLLKSIERLREGPKVRFGHTLFSEYHSYYVSGLVGHFRTDENLDVFVVDGRKDPRVRKLLLHVPGMNFTRALTEYHSRYIYTYGPTLLAEEPVEGSVMFMGDGDKIYRLMWLPAKGHALYPERVYRKR